MRQCVKGSVLATKLYLNTNMSQELMNYDKGRRRWRAMYKGKRLSVKVSDLGGTGRDDTLVAANRWYRQQVEEIDSQQTDSEAIFRPNEAEYLQNMESLFTSITALKTLKDKNLEPLIKTLKDRLDKTKEYLSKKSLPPLPDDLKNPLNIGEKSVAEKADVESVEDNLRYRMWTYENEKDNEGWLEGEGLYHISQFLDEDGFVDEDAFENEFDDNLPEHLKTENEKKRYIQKRLDEENTRIIRIRSGLPLAMRKKFFKEEEERVQLLPDYQRGKLKQKLEDRDLLVTTPSKLLATHIDKFLEHTEFLVKETKITPERAGKIIIVIQYYKNWTPINNVEKIGDKKHVDEYYKHLSQKVIDGEFSAHYARDIFAIWKQFLRWLYDEEIIKQFPKCLDRKDQKYKIKVIPKKVKTVAIQDVHTILEQANPRLQLCMLLTLNCGFGSAELGRLRKDQYDPQTGRITHKRIKTGGKSSSVPEVVYLLWGRTKALLDQHLKEQKKMFPKRPEYADYLLLNENGRPLWTSRLEGGKYKKSDNISCNFKRLVSALQKEGKIPHVNYYKLRKLPPSLIFNIRQFGELYRLWLGHAPKSVAERSYIETSDTVLDECILWLEQQIFESANLDPVDEITESVEETE